MTATYHMSNQFEQEKNKKAGGYTLITVAAIAFVLFIISWRLPQPEEPLLDQGIEVNLGNSDFGSGDIPPTMPGEPAPEQAEMAPSTPKSSPAAEEPITADDDNDEPDAPVLPKTKPHTTPKPKPVTNNNIATTKPTKAPPAPPAPKPKAVLGAYKGGNGNGGNNQDEFNNVKSQGIAGGTGDQGKANGNINSDNYKGDGGTGKSGVAITRGLTGRRITRFPSFEDDFNENAKIAVEIKVNENGAVTSAVYSSRGSTSSNATLKNIAIKKALQLKFNEGSDESTGTVVFNFRLKG
jgi:outer membrane biosynthesis protein TonB